MADGWTLIKTKTDFRAYQDKLVRDNNLTAHKVNWGNDPATYPCLVASCIVDSSRVLACYCLPEDARELLSATFSCPATPPAASAEAASTDADIKAQLRCFTKDWESFCQQTSALGLALLHELVEVGVTKEERFEKIFNRFLALAEQDVKERKQISARSAFDAIGYEAIMEEEEGKAA